MTANRRGHQGAKERASSVRLVAFRFDKRVQHSPAFGFRDPINCLKFVPREGPLVLGSGETAGVSAKLCAGGVKAAGDVSV